MVKEVYENVTYVKGKPVRTEYSRLVNKTIRGEGEKSKVSKAEYEAKKKEELKKSQEHNKELLKAAVKKSNTVEKSEKKGPENKVPGEKKA